MLLQEYTHRSRIWGTGVSGAEGGGAEGMRACAAGLRGGGVPLGAVYATVPSNTLIRDLEVEPPTNSERGRPPVRPWVRVDKWLVAQPASAWTPLNVRDGAQGPLLVERLKQRGAARTDRQQQASNEVPVAMRYKDRDNERVVKVDYYLSNGSAETPLLEFARVAKAEHRIEECIQRGKSEAGLADYEVRNWSGWHHHQTLSLIAAWFLLSETRRGKKWTPAITLPQIGEGIAQILHRACHCDSQSRIEHEREARLKRNELARLFHWKRHKRLAPLNINKRQI